MSQRPPDRLGALRIDYQATLIEFLRVDLDLAFTFLETAKTESESDPEHCKSAVAKAQAALETIRKFQGRIEDRDEWSKINSRADHLEAALSY
jgi:hypothetical protein